MENPFEVQDNKPQRSTFLLVLCILTFIGSGWGILSSLFSLFTAGLMDGNMQMDQISSTMNHMEGSEGFASIFSNFMSSSMEMLQVTMMYAREIALMQMVLYVISLLGAILMFQLRRVGFYLYVAAQILLLFVLPYFAGFSTLVVVSMLFGAFWACSFILMYALNLKYMK